MLAGAWTDTGWPATLEGAVLSGHAAAVEALEASASSRALEPHLAVVSGSGSRRRARDERVLIAAPLRLEALLIALGRARRRVHTTGMGPRRAQEAARSLTAAAR